MQKNTIIKNFIDTIEYLKKKHLPAVTSIVTIKEPQSLLISRY